MRIAFLGAGELVDAYCRSLAAVGHSVQTMRVWARSLHDATRGRRARTLAVDVGVTVTEDLDHALDGAQWVIAAVGGSQVCPTAEIVAARGPAHGWYLDLNSADPEEMRTAAALLASQGWRFLDGGVMGPAPLVGHRTPMVLSGTHAAAAASELGVFGFDVRVVGDQPGQASALKLLRNLIGKNFAAVVVEALLAAEMMGVRPIMEEYVLEALQMSDPHIRVDRWVSGTTLHAARRLKEQNATAEFVERAGGFSSMTRGACDLLAALIAIDPAAPSSGQAPAADTIETIARRLRARTGARA